MCMCVRAFQRQNEQRTRDCSASHAAIQYACKSRGRSQERAYLREAIFVTVFDVVF
jgi:hypothetical protein